MTLKWKRNMELKHIKIVNNLIDELDCERIASVMEFLDWKWASEEDHNVLQIPDEIDIRRQARNLLMLCADKAIQQGHYQLATGGFEVEAWYENNKLDCSIKFVIEEINNFE